MRKEEFTARLPSRTVFEEWSDTEKKQHLADLIEAFLDVVEAGNAPFGNWEINVLGTAMAALRSGFHGAALAEVFGLMVPEHERSTDPRYNAAAREVTLSELRQELAATRRWRGR